MELCTCTAVNDFNCDGVCTMCGKFVGDERDQKFWADEERFWADEEKYWDLTKFPED